jgi:hypothetical protein
MISFLGSSGEIDGDFQPTRLLIRHQPAVLFSQNKLVTSNQPTVLFSQNKPTTAISHQPNEQAVCEKYLLLLTRFFN